MDNLAGQDIGQYHLNKRLGHGGFADVYHGFDTQLEREVAIKVLNTRISDDDEKAFFHEARKTARLNHYNIIRIINYLVQDSMAFIILEYAPNGTLRERHPKGSHLPPNKIVDYVLQVASALQYAHSKNMIHCDVKPENLLIGEHNQILLSDFGVAIALKSLHVNLQKVGGTLYYMAPEQLQGNPCFASDQYSLAAVVYEWICGERPFQGPTLQAFYNQHLNIPPLPLSARVPDIPETVNKVVLTALEKDPDKRYPRIEDFAQALKVAFYNQVYEPPKVKAALRNSAKLDMPPKINPEEMQNQQSPSRNPFGPLTKFFVAKLRYLTKPLFASLKRFWVPAIILIVLCLLASSVFTFHIYDLFLYTAPTARPSPTLSSSDLTATATHRILSFSDYTPVSTDQTTQATPTLTYFKGEFYLAFIANDSTKRILLIHSSDGSNWSPSLLLSQASQTAPALAVFNGQLYLAFIADDSTNRILLIHSSDGINWSQSLLLPQASQTAPALAVFNDQLYLAFVANDSSNNLLIVSSQDGSTWSSNVLVGQKSTIGPALAAFDNQLYLAFIADNASRELLLTSSIDGASWSVNNLPLNEFSNTAPALASFDGKLYLAFVDNNTNTLSLLSSSDADYWSLDPNISQISNITPALCSYSQNQKPKSEHLYLAYVSDDYTLWIDQSKYDPI